MDTGAAGDTRHYPVRGQAVELETKAIRRFAKISESKAPTRAVRVGQHSALVSIDS